jgi:hypothetical protein
MSKAKIIAELPKLSPEDRAEVRAWLDRLESLKTASTTGSNGPLTARLRSPRLANPDQTSDFIKQVNGDAPLL